MAVPADIARRVSRETADRLLIFVEELRRWQRALNLVAPSTMTQIWTRHVDDSLQIAELESNGRAWIDLGSGGGLPGLIVAATDPTRPVVLVESDSRKAAFLRSTGRRMGVAADIRHARIETAIPDLLVVPETIVSARALAPLDRLLAYAQPLLAVGATGLFPKGRNADAELTEAAKSWIFTAETVPSRTDPESRIIRIRDFAGPRT